jgi:hypothetical protein
MPDLQVIGSELVKFGCLRRAASRCIRSCSAGIGG